MVARYASRPQRDSRGVRGRVYRCRAPSLTRARSPRAYGAYGAYGAAKC